MTEPENKFWKYFKKKAKKTQKYVTSYDSFGVPITVNYKGDDTYKTLFGAICTLFVVALMLFYSYSGIVQLVERTEPDRTSYKMSVSRDKDDALNLPDNNSQMYIGLRETVEYRDGTRLSFFIDFDPAYINGKIDYYIKGSLDARKNLEICEESELTDFASKVDNTNGVVLNDFSTMRCIPRETFELYN